MNTACRVRHQNRSHCHLSRAIATRSTRLSPIGTGCVSQHQLCRRAAGPPAESRGCAARSPKCRGDGSATTQKRLCGLVDGSAAPQRRLPRVGVAPQQDTARPAAASQARSNRGRPPPRSRWDPGRSPTRLCGEGRQVSGVALMTECVARGAVRKITPGDTRRVDKQLTKRNANIKPYNFLSGGITSPQHHTSGPRCDHVTGTL